MSGLAITGAANGVGTTAYQRLGESFKDETAFWGDKVGCRVPLTILKWKQQLGYELSPLEQNGVLVAETGKNIFGIATAPGEAVKLAKAVTDFTEKPTWENAKEVVVKGSALGAPINDFFDLCKKWFPLPAAATTAWGAIGPVTLGIGMTDWSAKSAYDLTSEVGVIGKSKLHEAKTPEEVKERTKVVEDSLRRAVKTLADLATAVSYLVLAIILFISFCVGTLVVAPVVPLILVTVALVSTLFKKFYEKIVVEAMHPDDRKTPDVPITA